MIQPKCCVHTLLLMNRVVVLRLWHAVAFILFLYSWWNLYKSINTHQVVKSELQDFLMHSMSKIWTNLLDELSTSGSQLGDSANVGSSEIRHLVSLS